MINFSTFTKCKTENDILREKYLNEDIFKIGLKITNGEKIGEIIRRGPNYVICLDENKNVFRSWITDIKEYVEEKPKKINKYRNYNNIRNNMDSVQSAAIFLGMLPEHSYKIRRAVERTILEGMDYDTAVKTISEDLKSSFLVNKAVEYYDAIFSEAANPQMMAQKAKDTAKTIVSQAQAKGTIAAAKIKAKQVQDNAMKAAKKSAQMKEEEELDELNITGNLQSYQKPGKRAKVKMALKKLRSGNTSKNDIAWFKEEDNEIDEAMINPRTRMASRQKMNPNEIRVQAKMGSPLAKKIRQQSGLAEEDPCWKGYTQVGMKTKNGKEVPNCVPSKGVKKATGYKSEELKGNQHELDVEPPYNKLTAKDFKSLRKGKRVAKESYSNWRDEINLSDNLLEKVANVKGNVILNPDTKDCPNCGECMDEATNTCPNCDVNQLRTKYHEEDYELIEKRLTAKMKGKVEDIVKGMKKNITDLKSRYGDRWKEVMYATATKRAMAMEEVEELDEAQERYGVYDRRKGSWIQTGISQQSALALRRRAIQAGRSSREVVIRKVKY